jgi:hypothetical protein
LRKKEEAKHRRKVEEREYRKAELGKQHKKTHPYKKV